MKSAIQVGAGRELDAMIAERIMGWRWHEVLAVWSPYPYSTLAETRSASEWCPSTDIAVAWEVLEVMHGRGFGIEVFRYGKSEGLEVLWFVDIGGADTVSAETAPLAICRAALAALEWDAANHPNSAVQS